mgnify:CR=1 FL=1
MTEGDESPLEAYDPAIENFHMLSVIWAALCGGVVLYTLVVFWLSFSGAVGFGLPEYVMYGAAPFGLLWLLGILFFRRRAIGTLVEQLRPEERFSHYQTMVITMLAMMEFGGLWVVTAAFMSNQPYWALVGGGAATYLMVRARPSEAEFMGE